MTGLTQTAQTHSPLPVSTNPDQLTLWTTDWDGRLHLYHFMSRALSAMQGAPSLPPSSSTAGALLLASYILILFIRTVFRRRFSQETCQNNLTEPGHGLPDHKHCDTLPPSYTRHSLVELGTSQKLKRTLRNPVLDHLPSMCLLYKKYALVATLVTGSKTWPLVAVLRSDETDFKLKLIGRYKGNFILVKGMIHQKNISAYTQ